VDGRGSSTVRRHFSQSGQVVSIERTASGRQSADVGDSAASHSSGGDTIKKIVTGVLIAV